MRLNKFAVAVLLGSAAAISSTSAAYAQNAQTREMTFRISAGDLITGLRQFSRQSRVEVIFKASDLRGKKTSGVSGSMTAPQALQRLLNASGATLVRDPSGAYLVRPVGNGNDIEPEKISLPQDGTVQSDEIVVTAQKRPERLLDVPNSIAVITNEDLQRRGVARLDDYLRVTPGVNLLDLGNSTQRVVFRGIATDPEIERPTSAIYFGEVPISVSSTGGVGTSSDLRAVDMQRIEILRGPQGTLYGASSMGGLLKQIPNSPNLGEVEGEIAGGYSRTERLGGDNTSIRGMINIPLVQDRLAVRVVGYRYQDSGYYENIAASDPAFVAIAADFGATAVDERNVGRSKTLGGRVSLAWKISSNLSAELMYIKQRDEGGVSEAMTGLGDYQQTRLRTVIDGVARSPDRRADVDIANAVLSLGTGPVQFISSTSLIWKDVNANYDYTAVFGAPIGSSEPATVKIFTQELRASSNLSGPFQFVVGGYLEDIDETGDQAIVWSGDPAQNFFEPGRTLIHTAKTANGRRQYAVFGEVSAKITPALTARLGGRHFDFTSTLHAENSGLFGESSDRFRSKESGQTFSASVDYEVSRRAMVYGRWAQGFRPGIPVDPSVGRSETCDANGDGLIDGLGFAAPTAIKADRVNSYEAGVKTSLAGGAFGLNASVYRIDWKDIPLGVRAPSPCLGVFTLNAGSARSQGFEIEGRVRPATGVSLDVGVSFTDAKLRSDIPDLGGEKGDRLPGTPRFKVNVGLMYEADIGTSKAFARADYAYISGFTNNLTDDDDASDLVAGRYHQVNLRAGSSIGPVEVDLFVNNLLNEVAYTWVGLRYSGTAYYLRPRTAGIDLRYRF
jgi:outer membrane receptor protein involved in Fe transport